MPHPPRTSGSRRLQCQLTGPLQRPRWAYRTLEDRDRIGSWLPRSREVHQPTVPHRGRRPNLGDQRWSPCRIAGRTARRPSGESLGGPYQVAQRRHPCHLPGVSTRLFRLRHLPADRAIPHGDLQGGPHHASSERHLRHHPGGDARPRAPHHSRRGA